jgi:alkanesulfonate monooxygenase SsuD/methylene tetrahydromethanopterin reductase-like flavin-dependent oxidoreductase (luciferase family)
LTGSKDKVRDRLQAFVEAGVQHLVVALSAPYDREMLRRLAREIIPEFRKG